MTWDCDEVMLLPFIALSLTPFVIVALAALIAPRLGRGLRAAGIAVILLLAALSTPLVSQGLLSRLEVWAPLTPAAAAAGDAQAIVILAAEQHPRPEFGGFGPGPLSLERLRYGAYLAKRTKLPVLVSGGDPAREGVPLADTLASALLESFEVRATWRERRSLNTVGNARNSAEILKAQGVTRVLLVTHAWHMPRARLAFERAGLQVTPAPTAAVGNPAHRIHDASGWIRALTPQAQSLETSYYFIHEVIGWVVLRMTPA